MRTTGRLLLSGLAAVACAIGAWYAFHARRESPREGAGTERDAAQTEQPTAAATTAPAPSTLDERQSTATLALRGRVVDAQGRAVAGAEVSWHARPIGDLASLAERNPFARDTERAMVRRAESGATGEFGFDAAPEDPAAAGTILWVTHAGHAAKWLALPADRAQWPTLFECQLEPRDATRVRVVDATGASLAGAEIVHLALIDAARPTLDAEDAHARNVFERSWTTDSSGSLAFAAVDDLQLLVARFGELLSAPWQGEDPFGEEVVLRVGPTFTVGGRLAFVSGEPDETPLRVHAEALAGKRSTELGTWTVAVGAWGPIRLPCVVDDEVRFEVSGGGALARTETRPTPGPGEHLTIDFDLERGRTIEVRVVDDVTETGIAGARVRASSLVGANEFRISESRTDADGMAVVRGVGPQQVYLAAMASGYVKLTTGELYFGADDDAPYEMRLGAGGRLAGRVLHDGQPLSDFEIVFWQKNPYPIQSRDFFRREDGRFEIDEVPLGLVNVVASTVDLPSCAPIRVEVTADAVAEIELVLELPSRAKGRVVDAATSEPIATARVQLWSHWANKFLSKRGSAHPVEADGSFDITGFQAGDEWFMVEAPGYAPWIQNVSIQPGVTNDLGALPLPRRQDLTVRLHSDGPCDFTSLDLEARGRERYPPVRFDAAGTAVMRGMEPGFFRIEVFFPDGSNTSQKVTLVPGQLWELDVEVASVARLSLEVEAAAGSSLPADLAFRCAYACAPGQSCEAWGNVSPDGRGRFEHLPAARAQIEVYDSTGMLAVKQVDLVQGENEVRLRLGGELIVLRTVDSQERPLPNTEVWLCAPSESPAWSVRVFTAGDATVAIPVIGFERVVASIYKASQGCVAAIPLDLSRPRDEPIDLVLDAPARLELAAHDGTLPLPGLRLTIQDLTRKLVLREATTDTQATYVFAPVSESPFLVHVTHPGFWPATTEVRATRHGPAAVIQARRLGSITIQARDASTGATRVELPIELRSVEFDTLVSAWIEQGKVPRPVHGLATDSSGSLTLTGLPHGAYQWFVNGAQGSLEVPPHASASATIVVP